MTAGGATGPAGEAALAPEARAVIRIHKDETGVILSVNEAMTYVLGWQPEEVVGHRSLEFIHPQDHGTVYTGWVRMLSSPGNRQRVRVRHSDSAERWVLMDMTNHNLLHDPDHRVVITEMVPATADTPEDDLTWVSDQLLRRLTESLPLGVVQIDRTGRIIFSNEQLDRILGKPVAGTLVEEFDGVVSADREVLDQALAAVLSGSDGDVEISLVTPEQGLRSCDIRLRALTDRSGIAVIGAVLCVIDVTEQARHRKEIEHRATYDGLTQILNRLSIQTVLKDAVANCAEHGVAVAFVDLDQFKSINDTYGHAVGDDLLRTIAGRLRSTARETDYVGRTGGDEFVIVCPGVGSDEAALRVGNRISTVVREPVNLNGAIFVPSASIGLAWSRSPTESTEALVARADEAMYESKRKRIGRPVTAPAEPDAGYPD